MHQQKCEHRHSAALESNSTTERDLANGVAPANRCELQQSSSTFSELPIDLARPGSILRSGAPIGDTIEILVGRYPGPDTV
jgi:hypothetical protein